ncbi:M67 family metallopeptidase [Phaeovibrio sulfidiphilus]|uniref:M67 family metallopeptidase n=1 Tax=Phaeovibrio sulfidiphilus TaxID=1220600 RepID=A0A8J6YZR8_9PROT|nr:M67 family metallopeptidase [Phaeovibrio sulfidiphilus]
MSITFRSSVIRTLLADVRARAPQEACGLLGAAGGDVCLVLPLTNALASPDRFRLDPREQFDSARLLRARGLDLVAIYHSHPHTDAVPSLEDRELARGVPHLQMIVSLVDPEPRLRLFEPEYRGERPLVVV